MSCKLSMLAVRIVCIFARSASRSELSSVPSKVIVNLYAVSVESADVDISNTPSACVPKFKIAI